MRAWMILGVLLATSALAGPSVPAMDLANVPEAWRAQWSEHDANVAAARKTANEAMIAMNRAATDLATANRTLSDAQKRAKSADKALKKAKKKASSAQARAAAEERGRAAAAYSEAERAVAQAQADNDLRRAEFRVADARREVLECQLELIKAQAVLDSGGYAEMSRFDNALTRARALLGTAEEELVVAKSKAVLTRQGG